MDNQIKVIIGLGNPGVRFVKTRHNIGFIVLDALAASNNATWQTKDNLEYAEIELNGNRTLLVKPQTFMNDSGQVIPFLKKKGIEVENVLVVHDELEFPFGKVRLKEGGSARGHNGLRSIIDFIGPDFRRIQCGIGRPVERDMVADYVLKNFAEGDAAVDQMVDDAIIEIEKLPSD